MKLASTSRPLLAALVLTVTACGSSILCSQPTVRASFPRELVCIRADSH